LKDNIPKKIKEEFALKEFESQSIYFIFFQSSILISCTTILKIPYFLYYFNNFLCYR